MMRDKALVLSHLEAEAEGFQWLQLRQSLHEPLHGDTSDSGLTPIAVFGYAEDEASRILSTVA
jgi:hypothetical protein